MTIVYLIFILLAAWCSYKYDDVEQVKAPAPKDDAASNLAKDCTEHSEATLLEANKAYRYKTHRFWALCLMLIMISGFSYGLGGDKFTYLGNFDDLSLDLSLFDSIYYGILLQSYMPFWTIINLIAKGVCDSFILVQFVQSAIVNTLFCYFVSKYTKRWFLFLLLYFLSEVYFQFNMEVMREGIALGISLLAFNAYLDGKKIRFFLYFLLALMFHLSAFIILLFPFVRFKISRMTLFYALGLAFVAWAGSDLLLVAVAKFAIGGIGALIQKVLFYALQASNIFGFARSAITYIIFPFVIMYVSVQHEQDADLRQRKERFMAFHIFLSIIGCAFAGFSRARNYAEILYLVMFADFVYLLFRNNRHLISYSFVLAGTFFLIGLKYFLYYPGNKAYFYQLFVPYTTVFTDDYRDVRYRDLIHQEAVEVVVSDDNTRDVK